MPQASVHCSTYRRFGLLFLLVGLVLSVGAPARAVTFTLQWTGTEADPQRALAVGDLDQDGDLDMVAGNGPPRFYSNNGTGVFTLYNAGGAGDNVFDADMGDFNNDGLLDYVIANAGGNPTRVYLNIGGGGLAQAWASPETVDTVGGVAAADFNNDGYLDIVTGANGGPKRVYLNNADGTGALTLFWTSLETTESTRSVDVGDTDGDGDLDFVVGNTTEAPRLYVNNGDGTFISMWTGSFAEANLSIHLVDLDGDGDPDIAASGSSVNSRVYENVGSNMFNSVWTSGESINQAEMDYGDMDADGDMDLVRTGTSANITVFLNNGAFAFTPDVVASPADDTQGVELGDVNGDNKLDILVANYFQNSKVYLNTYGGSNTAPPPPTAVPEPDGASGSFKLEWSSGGVDDHTPAGLITYNLRVGTAPMAGDVVSAFIPAGPGRPGGSALSWSLYLSDSGSTRTFFWSVQAIDSTGFTKGGFSAEDSFTVGGAPDVNPPPDVMAVFVDGPFQTSSTDLSASWIPGADDPETGTVAYVVEVVDNIPSVVSSSTVLSPSTTVNFANLSLVPGVPYGVKVKAKDGGNNLAPGVVSPPVVVEGTPPTGPTMATDDGPNTSNLTSLNVMWDAANDAESGLLGFVLNVGTTPFGSDVLLDFPAMGPSSANVPVSLTAGLTYFVSVAALNNAGMTGSYVTTDGILAQTPADVSPPTGPTFINDYGLSTSNLTGLNVTWDPANDPESSIASYAFNVGITPGGTELLADFLQPPSPQSAFIPVGLSPAQTYYVSVAAINGAGLTGSYVTTDGILTDGGGDGTPPSGPMFITDDGVSTSNLSGLSVSWDAAIDIESNIGGYVFKVGLTPGGSEMLSDFLQPPSPQSAIVPVGLTPGQTYYVSVAAVNMAGLTGSYVGTDGILAQAPVDGTPPTGPTFITDDGASTSNLSGLSVSWDAAIDIESNIGGYVFKVGLTPGGSELMMDFMQPPFPETTVIPVGLTPGQTYFVSVAAVNMAGLTGSYVDTDGILAQTPTDGTPPTGPTFITDDGVSTNNLSGLSVSWDAATDVESSIAGYVFKVGLTPGGSELMMDFMQPPFPETTVIPVGLTPGQTYFVSVAAVNMAGLTGSYVDSDGILAGAPAGGDSTPPSVVADIQPMGPYVNTPDTLVFSWLPATDMESPVTAYSVSLTLAGAGPTLLAELGTSIPTATFTGLGLSEGQTVYATVVAINSVGLSSDPAMGAPLTIDLTPPVATLLIYQVVSSGETLAVELNIMGATDNFSLTLSYALERNTAILSEGVCIDPGPFSPFMDLPPDTLNTTDFGVAPGACYGYRLLVTDSAGNVATEDPGVLLALAPAGVTPSADLAGPAGGFIAYPDGEVSQSLLLIQFAPGTDPSGLSPDAFIDIASGPYDGVNCGVMAPFTQFAVAATSQTEAPVTLLPNTCHQFTLMVTDTLGNSTTYTSPNIVKFAEGPPPVLSAPLTLMSTTADLGAVTPGSMSIEAFVGLTAHEALSNVRVFPTSLVAASLPVSGMSRSASVVSTTGAANIPFSMVVSDPMVIPALSAGDTADILVRVLAPAGLPAGLYEGLQTVYSDLNGSFTPDENEPAAVFLLRVYVPDFAALDLTCPLEDLPPSDTTPAGGITQ